jgi:hypothetical protein
VASNEHNILQLEIYFIQNTKMLFRAFTISFWVGTNKSDVVKVTENNVVIPGISSLCDQELKNIATFEYTVAVNDKKYETVVESNPRKV